MLRIRDVLTGFDSVAGFVPRISGPAAFLEFAL